MDTDELFGHIASDPSNINIVEIDPLHDTIALQLQKYLARIILDVKYDQNMSQSCVDTVLFKFKQYFNDCISISLSEVISKLILKKIINEIKL